MNEFVKLLQKDKPALIMSLPCNDPALCRAAFEEGADVVKVHINVEHRASGTCFGRLAQEREALGQMLAQAKGPMGLVPGGSLEAVGLDIREAAQMGFAFFSTYIHHMIVPCPGPEPAWMAACDGSYALWEIEQLAHSGAQVLEASVMPGAEYGQPLSMRDVVRYGAIAARTALPMVIPTQRFICPEQVPALRDAGMKGLMIGAVVTGRTQESIRRSVAAFRNAIDRM